MADIKDFSRYCKNHYCDNCPLMENFNSCKQHLQTSPQSADNIITEWCKEHPERTYKQDFLEKFPNASISKDGTLAICRALVYSTDCPDEARDCSGCWNEIM